MPAIILFAVWKNFGYNMIIFVAGLQTVPEELYEKRLGSTGASAFARFWHVTLPAWRTSSCWGQLAGPSPATNATLRRPLRRGPGGPGQSTDSVLYFMYEQGCEMVELGVASAVAFLLFVLMLAVTLAQGWPLLDSGACCERAAPRQA